MDVPENATNDIESTQWTNVTEQSVNITTPYSLVGEHEYALKIALEVLLTCLLAFVMLAMGADITWKDVWTHLRRPVGVIIGMTSQFLILPLSAFSLSHAFGLPAYQAMSLIIVSCCPGGVVSNLFTMWCRGNVSLSICMTTMSTFLALAMMPLNLFVYSLSWVDENVHVPYDKLATTLVTILIPVLIGVSIKSRFPKAAPWIIRIGTTAGFLAVVASVVIQSLLIPGLFDCGWHVYFASMLLPLMGFSFGFFWSWMFRMSIRDCRTVAFETGSQNIPLALTIILLSFPFDKQRDMTPYPMLFIIFIHIEAISYAIVFRWWYIRHKKKKACGNATELKIISSRSKPCSTEELNSSEVSPGKKYTTENGTCPEECSMLPSSA